MADPGTRQSLRLKRALRRLIPDRVMARYRLEQHSRHSRVNVDLFNLNRRNARRWLSVTPDTYRARLQLPTDDPRADAVVLKDDSLPVEEPIRADLERVMADSGIDIAVAADTGRPRLIDRRRVEPEIGPRLIIMGRQALEEVGGLPPGEHPLPGLLARSRDAGHRIGLIFLRDAGAPARRSDPIENRPVVILAAVPMHDIGGGARSTQLALEFLRQGFHVTLVSLYGAQETVDLGLRYLHPNLEQYQVSTFDARSHHSRSTGPGLALVEAPAAPLIARARQLQEAGWEVVYDMIDDWSDRALGGDWYREQDERMLVSSANRVVASAPDLVARATAMGREAVLVPNAVNPEIFGVHDPLPPADLPQAAFVIGYHGSLYGDWFDWETLGRVARSFPEAAVVLIGDDKARRPETPENVYFLGLKPQTALPAYLQRFDVGIVPFRVTATTHAVSPLKVYEYLASGVPVAATPLRTLLDLEGVSTSEDLVEAIRAARSAHRPSRDQALRMHSWEARVRLLVDGDQHQPGVGARTVLRPAIHWPRSERLVTG